MDPFNKLKIENAKLLEKIKQTQENMDILNNKLLDAQNQTKSFEKLTEEKSNRLANMHEEHENLRLNLQKYESELTGRISQAESKKLTSDNDYLVREMTKLRGENHKYKDLMFVLSRQVETQNKMRDHNSVQVEILNNALNTIVSEKDNSDAWVKLVNEVDVHRLQSI